METLTFNTSAEFLQWAKRIVKYKYHNYDRMPVGKQTWAYGDGHLAETEWGKKRGTVLVNLGFMINIAAGGLDQQWDKRLIEDVDAHNGVTITIHWNE
ncbi:hypothetical protein [Mesorhizobium caraganae]|uniref:hypothetical protein n=1 Tax=Mesorhizobium caraganae TaxID=483206 RepID=UPI00333831D1